MSGGGQSQGFNGSGFGNQSMANPQQFPGPSGSNFPAPPATPDRGGIRANPWASNTGTPAPTLGMGMPGLGANPQQMPPPGTGGVKSMPNPYGYQNPYNYMGPDPSQILGTGGGLGAYMKLHGGTRDPNAQPPQMQPHPGFGGERMNFPQLANPGVRSPWEVPGGPTRGGGNNQILPMPFGSSY